MPQTDLSIGPQSDCERPRAHLLAHAGEFVECPHGAFGVTNSRIAELRKRRLVIESKFWERRDDGRVVYRYRLVIEALEAPER